MKYYMTKAETKIEEYLLANYVKDPEVTFSTYVFGRVDLLLAKGSIKKESQVYQRGNIDRRVYSNLKKATQGFRPYKSTALAFCIALELSIEEASYLMSLAGYHFEDTDIADQVVKCCLDMGVYSVDEVNSYIAEFAEQYEVDKVNYIGSSCRKDRQS